MFHAAVLHAHKFSVWIQFISNSFFLFFSSKTFDVSVWCINWSFVLSCSGAIGLASKRCIKPVQITAAASCETGFFGELLKTRKLRYVWVLSWILPDSYYIHQGGGYVIRSFICHSVYTQHYCKIALKLCFIIGPSDWKNWLNFGGDPVPDTDCGSLFHFPHHCGIEDF